jgi:hypothetical protein
MKEHIMSDISLINTVIEQLAKKFNDQKLHLEKFSNRLASYKGKESFYNDNFYELEDGTVIHEEFDEFYGEGRLTLYEFEGEEYDGEYVGYTNRNGIVTFTNIENT